MSLNDVIGQGPALRMLSGAIKNERVASSYLFAGEQGIGKRFAALNFAKALNCLDTIGGDGYEDACESCPSCRKFASGNHPDFLLIEPEGGLIKVDRIRRIEETLSLKAFEGRTKVVIVDEADTMNINASNAFLKTLEEPSPKSLIILVSSRPDRLPATIRSRCMRINFRPLSPDDCLRVIGGKGKDSALKIRLSMGRPGLAVSRNLLRQRDRFWNSLTKMLNEESKHPWKDREDLQEWLDMSLLLMRDLAVTKITGGGGKLVNEDISDNIGEMSGRAPLKVIIENYEKLRSLRGNTGFNLNRAVTWNYIRSIMEAFSHMEEKITVDEVVGVRFDNASKIYCFTSHGVELRTGDRVVVESELGMSLGRVVSTGLAADDPDREIKPISRKVTEDDLRKEKENEPFKVEAREFCMERIMARGLPMKLVATNITLDRKRYIFYFVAETRIDFRELVKDLASKFRTRIELRQIGVRDAAMITGGYGLCGREFCCRTFLRSFSPISIKMAKQQDLVLNTSKLSGTCGRLMCCLNYECNEYLERKAANKEAAKAARARAAETSPPVAAEKPNEPVPAVSTEREKTGFRKRRRSSRKPRPAAEKRNETKAAADGGASVSGGETKKEEAKKPSRRSRKRRWRKSGKDTNKK
jgi:DNA polymerase III delta' subunit